MVDETEIEKHKKNMKAGKNLNRADWFSSVQ